MDTTMNVLVNTESNCDDECWIVTPERLKEMSISQVVQLQLSTTDWNSIMNDKKVREGLEYVSKVFERANIVFIPSKLLICNAFVMTPWHKVEVVMFGQDPYPEPGVPTGLAFSVNRGMPITRSLEMLFGVYSRTLGYERPKHGCLIKWALQGVLLLNTGLTTQPHKSNEHTVTWQTFIEPLILKMSETKPLIWVLLGGEAQKLRKDKIKGSNHVFIEAPHPVARDNSFGGCNIFNDINAALKNRGKEPIDWQL